MDREHIYNAIKKLLKVIKPEEVIDIRFDLQHTSPAEFTLYTTFTVSEKWWDSLDEINRAAFMHHTKVYLRQQIKNYLGINVLFDKYNTSIKKV